jgi:transcriptional regulator with XRE-family HTH domain
MTSSTSFAWQEPRRFFLPVLEASEIQGEYKELARLVRSITGNVASRVAARRSGISHDTIGRLWQGDRVSDTTLIRFAIGYGIDPNELLDAAGYPKLKSDQTLAANNLRTKSGVTATLKMQESPGPYITSDPLAALGDEIDPTPILHALRDVGAAVAGDATRWPYVAAPGEVIEVGPVRAKRIIGECMEPYLYEGDIVLITRPEEARDGDIVIATVDFEHTICKQVKITDDDSWLQPINGEGVITEDRFTIVGVVFSINRNPQKDLELRKKLLNSGSFHSAEKK